MPYCTKCGKQMDDGTAFCSSCGVSLNSNNTSNQNTFSAKLQDLNNTPDSTLDFDPADISQNKFLALFAYLGVLILVPIFGAKDSKFARFHANQGLVLILTELAYCICYMIISSILMAISPYLIFISFLMVLCNLAYLALIIIGIINALNGKAKELPVIGKFRILN